MDYTQLLEEIKEHSFKELTDLVQFLETEVNRRVHERSAAFSTIERIAATYNIEVTGRFLDSEGTMNSITEPPKRRYRPNRLSKSTIRHLIALRRKGIPRSVVAKELGISIPTVSRHESKPAA